MSSILFWDIDGTLLTTARAGLFAFEEAAREVCGTEPDLSTLRTAGLTDSEVSALVIAHCGEVPEPGTVSAVLRAYERHLPERLHWRQGRVLPGVEDVLRDLSGRPNVHCMLLTGNTEAGANAKLTHYGLSGYFEGGAFCGDGDDRVTIARAARRRANGSVARANVFVIGDTPHDVRCGKAIDARTVAVATGPYSIGELEPCGPWLALEQLPDPGRFRELLELPDARAASR